MARLFVLELNYHRGLDPIEAHLVAHRAYLAENYAAGRFLASGPKEPRTGGVILATGTREEIERTIAADPFSLHDAAQYTVTEFVPSMTNNVLATFREDL